MRLENTWSRIVLPWRLLRWTCKSVEWEERDGWVADLLGVDFVCWDESRRRVGFGDRLGFQIWVCLRLDFGRWTKWRRRLLECGPGPICLSPDYRDSSLVWPSWTGSWRWATTCHRLCERRFRRGSRPQARLRGRIRKYRLYTLRSWPRCCRTCRSSFHRPRNNSWTSPLRWGLCTLAIPDSLFGI